MEQWINDMKKLIPMFLAIAVVSIFAVGCAKQEEGDPNATKTTTDAPKTGDLQSPATESTKAEAPKADAPKTEEGKKEEHSKDDGHGH